MAVPGFISTHAQDARERLLEQYKGKERFEALLNAFNAQVQELEQVFSDIYVSNAIANAVGASLDEIGSIVGQARLGFDDDRYRSLIFAKIGENTSQGDPEKILQVVKLLAVANVAMIQDWYPAGYGLWFSNSIPSGLVNFFYERLDNVDPAGVRLEALITFDEHDAFAFAGSAGSASGFGDSTNPAVGGKFAVLELENRSGSFSFASEEGFETDGDGFGTLEDNLVGGVFE